MKYNYQEYWDKLNQYIHNHPQIKIERHSVSIPEDLRQEFYTVFKQVLVELLNDKYPQLVEEAQALSQNYKKEEQQISRGHYNSNDRKIILSKKAARKKTSNPLFNIIPIFRPANFKADCIILDPYSDEFLHDPVGALSRMIFGSLFDLLQCKISTDEFEAAVDKRLNSEFRNLYQLCYEKWIILSLLRMAKSTILYSVTSDFVEAKVLVKQQFDINANKCQIPFPKETNLVVLDYNQRKHALSTVDLLIHAKWKGKYIGIKTKYETAAYSVINAPKHRASLPFESVKNTLIKNPILIYVGDDMADVSLVSDKEHFWRPDIVLDIYETFSDSIPNMLTHNALKPTIGTVVIPCPFSASKPTDYSTDGFSVLNVGFDQSKLKFIIDRVSHGQSSIVR